MAERMLKVDFYDDAQWNEHQDILKKLECRCVYAIRSDASTIVFYKKGIADYSFMMRYSLDGTSSLFFEHPSFDNIKTLKALMSGA